MHELSIAHSILSIAERSFPAEATGFIHAVNIQVGELSSIDTEALLFAFSAIRSGTVLERAVLQIETIPGEARCSDCGTVYHLDSFGKACPHCQGYLVNILQGKELKVLSLSVEEEEPATHA
ncbi:MAG: hydrogenase maturation nickel metallochaperone HypA [Chitinophagales bacterium]|nr:hydrogenase maturation nickel metallochaperone HypA [Chitinophagales bacterium]